MLASWYLPQESDLWLAELWRASLRRFAPDVPLLVVDNASPVPYPWDDWQVQNPYTLPHARGTAAHFANSWSALCHGFRTLAAAGVRYGIYIEQDVVVGAPFVSRCVAALQHADVLLTGSCMHPDWAYTECLAGRTAAPLWERPYPAECTPGEAFPLPEAFLTAWSAELGLRVAPVPGLVHERDGPLRPTDTYTHHCARAEVEAFARARGIV